MKKNTDVLVYVDESEKIIRAQNRFTNEIFSFPRKTVCRQLRRLSEIDRIDISDDKEYIVCKYYDELPHVLLKIYPAEMAKVFEQRIRLDWEKKVNHGMSSFVFTRKVDLSASGTRLLSLFSEEPRFLSADSWGIRNLSLMIQKYSLYVSTALSSLQRFCQSEPKPLVIDETTLVTLVIGCHQPIDLYPQNLHVLTCLRPPCNPSFNSPERDIFRARVRFDPPKQDSRLFIQDSECPLAAKEGRLRQFCFEGV
jgi:hypothetical protein